MTKNNEGFEVIKIGAGHYTVGTYTIKKIKKEEWAIWDVFETDENAPLDYAGCFDVAKSLTKAVELVEEYMANDMNGASDSTKQDEEEDIHSTVYGAGRIYYGTTVAKYTYSRGNSSVAQLRRLAKGMRKYSVETLARKIGASTGRVKDLTYWLQRKEGFCIHIENGIFYPAGLIK